MSADPHDTTRSPRLEEAVLSRTRRRIPSAASLLPVVLPVACVAPKPETIAADVGYVPLPDADLAATCERWATRTAGTG